MGSSRLSELTSYMVVVLFGIFGFFITELGQCQELVSGDDDRIFDQQAFWFRSSDIKNMEDIFDGIKGRLDKLESLNVVLTKLDNLDTKDNEKDDDGFVKEAEFIYPVHIDGIRVADLYVRIQKGRVVTEFVNKSEQFYTISFDSKDKVYVTRVNKTLVILSGIVRASVSASSAFLTAGVNPDVGYVGSIPTAVLSGTLAMGFHWFNDLYKYFLTRKSILDPKDHSSSTAPGWKLFYIGDGVLRDVMVSFPMMIMFSIACMVGEVMEGGESLVQQLSVIYTQPIGYFTPLLLGAFSNSISEGMLSIADGNLLKHRIQRAKIHNILNPKGLDQDVTRAKTTSYINGLMISVFATSSIVLLTIPEFSSHGFLVCAGMTAFGAAAIYFTELFYKWMDKRNDRLVGCLRTFGKK